MLTTADYKIFQNIFWKRKSWKWITKRHSCTIWVIQQLYSICNDVQRWKRFANQLVFNPILNQYNIWIYALNLTNIRLTKIKNKRKGKIWYRDAMPVIPVIRSTDTQLISSPRRSSGGMLFLDEVSNKC